MKGMTIPCRVRSLHIERRQVRGCMSQFDPQCLPRFGGPARDTACISVSETAARALLGKPLFPIALAPAQYFPNCLAPRNGLSSRRGFANIILKDNPFQARSSALVLSFPYLGASGRDPGHVPKKGYARLEPDRYQRPRLFPQSR